MQVIIGVLIVAVAMITTKGVFAQSDEECPVPPPGFHAVNPGFRPVDGHEYCLLNDLAERGTAIVQWNLAVLYDQWGKHSEANKWFRLAAEQGDAKAQNKVGSMYMGRGVSQDYAEAEKWYRLAAEQGDAKAQLQLGLIYRNGLGVPHDYAEAMKWYRLVAEHGHSSAQYHAQYNLGFMYDNGLGVPQDYAEAEKWYRLAAEQGDADAQLRLGFIYRNGLGVPQDYVTAHMWFIIYSKNVYVEAPGSRDLFEKNMTPADISRAQEMAREWREAH